NHATEPRHHGGGPDPSCGQPPSRRHLDGEQDRRCGRSSAEELLAGGLLDKELPTTAKLLAEGLLDEEMPSSEVEESWPYESPAGYIGDGGNLPACCSVDVVVGRMKKPVNVVAGRMWRPCPHKLLLAIWRRCLHGGELLLAHEGMPT
ncbi:hypothetical protein Dimus_001250, partial [Dionaea muscipula]